MIKSLKIAAIGVQLYTGYAERASVTEATSIMAAIITSQNGRGAGQETSIVDRLLRNLRPEESLSPMPRSSPLK